MKGSTLGKLGAVLARRWRWLVLVLVAAAVPLIVRAQQGQAPGRQPGNQDALGPCWSF